MKKHLSSGHHCPICDRAAILTSEWGWIDDDTCTATLRCQDCNDDRAVVCVHESVGDDDEETSEAEERAASLADSVGFG